MTPTSLAKRARDRRRTLGEIRRGLENIRHRGDAPQGQKLEAWLDLLVADYRDRILNFDEACAQVWGHLMSPRRENPIDKQIVAGSGLA